AGDRGGSLRGDLRRVGAEGAGTDDRVVVAGVHVDGRGEVEVEAGGQQVQPDRPVDPLGERGVVHAAQRRVARVRATRRVGQPGDVAALLVDRQEQVGPGGRELAGQRGQLVLVD